ncbi:MAG: hypothetical protein FD181_3585 [Prolixibacteraceae bacterium]|nr:MAG: hypothetical protein FD181_3585 [Prolixibacteraceae bacterium]
MKKLYQALTTFFKTLPLTNPEFELLKCPGFLMKLALHETPPDAENQLCYMDYYQLQQINLLKRIGINFTQTTTSNENL